MRAHRGLVVSMFASHGIGIENGYMFDLLTNYCFTFDKILLGE